MFVKVFGAMVLLTAAGACHADSRSGEPSADSAALADAGFSPTPASASAVPPPSASRSTWVDPNAAPAADMVAIPGMTQALSDAVIAGRPHANMVAVNALLARSLGEKARDSIYTRLWIPLDLNKATGEEILLIPGVGKRMEHEFMEYRPYTSIEQFRREIGKYADKDEVARLETYVTVR